MDYDENQTPTSPSRENGIEENDYEEFLQQIETDKEMRSHINIYRNKGRSMTAVEAPAVPDEEYIQLEELLDDMAVDDRNNRFEILNDEEKDAFDSSDFTPSDFKFL